MQSLNFPDYNFRVRQNASGQSSEIFDIVRKKFVALTPEEWVRQHLLHFLITLKKYPASLLSVEKELSVAGIKKRTDVVVYSRNAEPLLIAECKSPDVPLNQNVFDQAARYNLPLNVSWLLLTNGLVHYCCRINSGEKKYELVGEIPEYEKLVQSTLQREN
ncbi:MAG TPA: type I restriction enzyme HsdR N-terminal domain-containing protein [Bacteroidia bacterium]|nr:type I restriction enzyme HsdR N-terminal domain-containing protein [Bacteroidia bacterium]